MLLVKAAGVARFHVLVEDGIAVVATSIERHAEAKFLLWHTILYMGFHRFGRGDATREGRAEERRVMMRRIGHVVGHDVDEVHVLHAGPEINVLAIGYGGGGEQFAFAQHLSEVTRSEERRVGKECRSRWSPYH